MALVLIDGFEDTSQLSAGSGSISAGRTGNCITSGNALIQIPTALQSATILVGFALKITVGDISFFEFRGDTATTVHNSLVYRSGASGYIEFCRGGSPVLGHTGVGSFINGAWHYVEVTIVLSDTVGSVNIRINGITKLNLTNQDTKNAGTGTVYDAIMMNGGSGFYVDDFYMQTGTVTNWGDIVVETLYPNGNGAANTWVGSDSDSTNNYLLVNETGTPNTANYVQSSTSGNKDLYTLGDLVRTTGTVKGVCHTANLATDVGSAQAKIINRTTSTDTLSSAIDINTTYQNYMSAYDTDPEGGAWSISKVNGMQVGVQVV
jgi:hypothetical protein